MLQRFARAAVAALLAAGAALGTAQAQTTLEFPTWQAEEPGISTWWKELIAAYEKRYPDVKINLQQVPFAQFVKQMTVRFAAGNPPDVVHLPTRDFASFADQGWLEPLDERLKATDIAANWPPLQAEMQWNGRTQGVLLMGYGGILFYNEQKLKDAKLGVPRTPDEWLAAMKATTLADKGQFGLATITAEHPNMVVEMASWVVGSGADWLKGGRYNFNDPAVVKAVEGWRQSIAYAPKGTNSATARQLFIDGKVTFLRDGPWVWGALAKAPAEVKPHLKIAPLPFAATPGGASNSLHMAAKTDAKKKQAVWNFIAMAASPEWQNRYALTGSPAPRKGALTAADLAAQPHLKVINDEAAKARNLFPEVQAVRAGYNDFATAVTKAAMRMVSSPEPTAKVLSELQSELERSLPLK
ncbi:MAG: sugar ABC transporter substrate-binding protein [Betaproteobacteria bacterium]|jgi:multiple sugar transport system substrate-binding protein|nr:sugar ABC transporter substrate-binding protein [Betaproteobacteria bacterium]